MESSTTRTQCEYHCANGAISPLHSNDITLAKRKYHCNKVAISLSFMKKEQAQNTQPYSNMKARRVVLVLGFVMTIISFVVAIYASLALFFPALCVPKDVLPFKSITTLYVVSMSCSFLGIVFAVAGANTQKAIARLSFFFGTVAFIGSAGFLVVLLLVNFFPFQAIGNLLS